MVNKKLLNEIEEYCELNKLEVPKTLNEALRQGFTILQYGMGPNKPKVVEKPVEVIKEVIKEVPVEKIVEVPVEKIIEVIKEVPVDKIVEVEKNINVNIDGKEVNYIEYIDKLNTDISKLEVVNRQITKELTDSKTEVGRLNQVVTTSEGKIEQLRKDLKDCKDSGGFDIYGEK
jgi:outer membrane biosynthesis protein TonB